MHLTQNIIAETKDSTVSSLYHGEVFLGVIIEDGYRQIKVKHETRIPQGCYKLKRRTYGKFYDRYKESYGHKYVYELEGVQGFSDILIHKGNTIYNTSGCLLINSGFIFDGVDYVGRSSETAYLRLYDYLKDVKEDIWLTINRTPHISAYYNTDIA